MAHMVCPQVVFTGGPGGIRTRVDRVISMGLLGHYLSPLGHRPPQESGERATAPLLYALG